MSDFLDSLVDRSLGVGPMLRPQMPSRFEPPRQAARFGWYGEERDDTGARSPAQEGDRQAVHTPFQENEVLSRSLSDTSSYVPDAQMLRHHEPSRSVPNPELPRQPHPTTRWLPDAVPGRTDTVAHTTAESTPDMRWLHRRLDELSRHLNHANGGDDSATHGPALAIEFNHRPLPQPVLPDGLSGRDNLRDRIAQAVPPAVDDAAISQPLLLASAVPELLSPRSMPVVPHIEPNEELLALLSNSRLQSPPRVMSEDLEAISKHSAPQQPTINVTIGRVEVKATRDTPAPARPATRAGGKSVMTLEDYLRRRTAGGAG